MPSMLPGCRLSCLNSEGEIVLLTDDQDFIDRAKEYGVIPQGFDPRNYIDEEYEDENGE